MSAPSARERSTFDPLRLDDEDNSNWDKLFDKYDIKRDNSFPGRQPRSVSRNNKKFEDARPSSSGRFAERVRSYSPGATKSGEEILSRLKNQLRKEADMFFHSSPDWDYDNMQSKKVDDSDDWLHKGFDDMRSRHPMFRMPNWASQEDDVANLASRMSHSPHFASMGRRGGPWRERRSSGGSAMSGTSEEDSVDGPHADRLSQSSGGSTAVRIPIRIEAEAPPGCIPVQPQPQQQEQPHQPTRQNLQQSSDAAEPSNLMGQISKQPQFASKTTPAMDMVNNQEVPRNTRCSSAPPDMAEPLHGHKFVTKTNIVPPNTNENPFSSSPVFNNVAKPYVSSYKQEVTPPIMEEQPSDFPSDAQVRQNTQQHQYPTQEQYQQQQNTQQPPLYPQQPPQYSQQPQYQQPQQYSQQQQYQQPQSHPQWERESGGHKSSVVRNIPIIFEGRKDSSKEPPCKSPPKPHHPQPQPQHMPSRSQWDSFNTPSFGFPDEDPFFGFHTGHPPAGFHHSQPQPSQYQQQPKSQPPHPQPHHSHPPQPHHQPQPEQPHFQTPPQHFQAPPPPPPPPQPKEPSPPKDIKMKKIGYVRDEVTELQEKVKNFQGTDKNKEFIFIDEMLTRALLKLDDIDPDGRDDVRQARKTLIKDINNTISLLEKKVSEPKTSQDSETTQATPGEQSKPEDVPAANTLSPSNEPPKSHLPPKEGTTDQTKPEEMNVEETRVEGTSEPIQVDPSEPDKVAVTQSSADQLKSEATEEKMETEEKPNPPTTTEGEKSANT